MVPHLVTALNGPLLELEKTIIDSTPSIERWFRLEWQDHTPPFYCSVDLRNAGFKLTLGFFELLQPLLDYDFRDVELLWPMTGEAASV